MTLVDAALAKNALVSTAQGSPYPSLYGQAPRLLPQITDVIGESRLDDECSYEDCPYDGPATWFIDPPYQQAGKHYHYGSDTIKYGDLASWCMAREGHVLVCENEGAEWLQFKPLAEVKTTRRGNRSKEVIWSNRPIKPLQGRLLEDRPEV